jgi:hypothetical protein
MNATGSTIPGSAEVAVSAALAAQEKAVNAAFTASEKAVLKAEQAQKEYNERSNEFRGQLDDQAKTLMPRPETLNMFKAMEEKIAGVDHVTDAKIQNLSTNSKNDLESIRKEFIRATEAIDATIVSLRESRSETGGLRQAAHQSSDTQRSSLTIAVAIGFGFISLVVSVVALFMRAGNGRDPMTTDVTTPPLDRIEAHATVDGL